MEQHSTGRNVNALTLTAEAARVLCAGGKLWPEAADRTALFIKLN